jgi:vacuolar-type H+-ATPase subunit F/Vma7
MGDKQAATGSTLVSVIGDEVTTDDIKDTVTGFLLTGIGERNNKGETNFLVVDESKDIVTARDHKGRNRGDLQAVLEDPVHQHHPHQPARIPGLTRSPNSTSGL